jgi:CHAT domain-containing protein
MTQEVESLCAELADAATESHRQSVLEQHWPLVKADAVYQLAEAVRHAVRVDVAKARGYAEAALTIAVATRNEGAIARALRAKANALWHGGDCKSAVGFFRQAAELFEKVGERNELGRTLSSSIQSLSLLGDYVQAFNAAEKARQIFLEPRDGLRLARLNINVANVYHRQNRFAEALAAYERAYRELLPHKDVEGIGAALHNMAVCLIALDDFGRALEVYRRVRAHCAQHDMPLIACQADYNIAYLFYLRGRYTKALELLRAAKELCEHNGDLYHLGLCALDQSEIYLELVLVQEAEEMAESSLEQFKHLGMRYELGRSMVNLGLALSLQGKTERALQMLVEAKQLFVLENNHVWPSLLDLYCALVLFQEGAILKAHSLCSAALDLFRTLPLPSKRTLCHLLAARISLHTGDIVEAHRHCDDALQTLAHIDAPILLYQTHFLKGRINESEGRIQEAYDSYLNARAQLETLRSSLQKEELKIGFMSGRLEVYSRLAHLCLQPDSPLASKEAAFLYVEEAKSRAFRDLLLGRGQLLADRRYEDETDLHIAELSGKLNWCYNRIEREQLSAGSIGADSVQGLQEQARALEQEILRLFRHAPTGGHMTTVLRNSKAASLDGIRRALGGAKALLEYFCVGDQMYAAVITTSDLHIVPVAPSSAIYNCVRMFQFQLSKFRLGPKYTERFHDALLASTVHHLRELFQLVVAPVRSLLDVPSLVIVPYGALHSVPFHALLDGDEYLVEAFRISYAPSASIYAHCERHASASRKRVEGSGHSLILGIDDPRLPYLREEIEAVAASVPDSVVLIGKDATESALSIRGQHSRLIHIATHGYFRQDSPMFSAIRLADSHLNLFGLYHMHLPAELLTLSGCATGLNVLLEGDEPLGLARGLLHAGAQCLLLSLWDVDDRSTAEFMREFYSRLPQCSSKAEALRAAMLELRTRFVHPYYWAPFILMGSAHGN